MSRLYSVLMETSSPTARRRRGRPCVSDDPDKRAVHIECAKSHILYAVPVAKLADRLGVCPMTVRNWINLVLTSYDEPVAQRIREAKYGRSA